MDHVFTKQYMPSILLICTANICRSPMAMGLFKKKVDYDPDWRIESAGTWSIEDQPAAFYTQEVLARRGIDISDHKSRSVTGELLNQFNLILTMEEGHKEALSVEFPMIAPRVYLLSDMVGEQYNIQDPIGGPIEQFEMTAQEFERILNSGFQRIIQLASD
jgi:protein-tyrosine-phosphatase